MQKHKKRKKFLLPLAIAGALFLKGCSPLPEYKEYEEPKKVILHGQWGGDPGAFVSKHLEDLTGKHKGQHCGGRIARRNYIAWISDYLVEHFSSLPHKGHEWNKGHSWEDNYRPLLAIATDQSISTLIADVKLHARIYQDADTLYARLIYDELKAPRYRRQLEDYFANILADANEHCKKRIGVMYFVPRNRQEFREKSSYVCSKCYERCVSIEKDWGRNIITRGLGLPLNNPYASPPGYWNDKDYCIQESYPCLCIAMYAEEVALPTIKGN